MAIHTPRGAGIQPATLPRLPTPAATIPSFPRHPLPSRAGGNPTPVCPRPAPPYRHSRATPFLPAPAGIQPPSAHARRHDTVLPEPPQSFPRRRESKPRLPSPAATVPSLPRLPRHSRAGGNPNPGLFRRPTPILCILSIHVNNPPRHSRPSPVLPRRQLAQRPEPLLLLYVLESGPRYSRRPVDPGSATSSSFDHLQAFLRITSS